MNKFFRKNKPGRLSKRLSSIRTTGLTNEPGANNCFLNSAVQVLWHLDVFRVNFAQFNGHNCAPEGPCIFCAMKTLFAGFKYSNQQTLPPTDLRISLSDVYQSQNRFQLGLMDDAAECFEKLLYQIHKHLVSSCDDDDCSAKHCLPHQKFGMTLVQQEVCQCGEALEPMSFTQLVHYVPAKALCMKLREVNRNYRAPDRGKSFGRLVRAACTFGSGRDCPRNCGSQVKQRSTLTNCPDVISIGVNWDSNEPPQELINEFMHTLETTLHLPDMFDNVLDKSAQRSVFRLSAMVCYYGRHYSTFFYNRKRGHWLSIDDAQVSQVGRYFEDIVRKCVRGHYQPLLLLYANHDSKLLEISTAPVTIARPFSSSVQSSPAISHRDIDVTSSSSNESPASPCRSVDGAVPKPTKLLWNTIPTTKGSGHYKEPKSSDFTVYKPYPNAREKSKSLPPPKHDINDNTEGTSF